jgi:hypothetical protein
VASLQGPGTVWLPVGTSPQGVGYHNQEPGGPTGDSLQYTVVPQVIPLWYYMQGCKYNTGGRGVVRVGQHQGAPVYLYQYHQYPLYQHRGVLTYQPGMEVYSIVGVVPRPPRGGHPMDV